jgi:hypothetical protein
MHFRLHFQARLKQLGQLGQIVAVGSKAKDPGTGHYLKAEL